MTLTPDLVILVGITLTTLCGLGLVLALWYSKNK